MEPPWHALARGAELYRRGLYYEAHEAWEELWLELREEPALPATGGARRAEHPAAEPRRFVQGLIQVAAAGHKAFAQRQPRGCVKLLRAGLEKLEGTPAGFLGVETARLLPGVRRALAEAEQWLAGEREEPPVLPGVELIGPPPEKK